MCDRSVLDNYAYMVPASRRQRAIERFVDHWMGTYDLLFKVPVGPDRRTRLRDVALLENLHSLHTSVRADPAKAAS